MSPSWHDHMIVGNHDIQHHTRSHKSQMHRRHGFRRRRNTSSSIQLCGFEGYVTISHHAVNSATSRHWTRLDIQTDYS